MTDVRRDLGLLYRATVGEKEFIAVLARASLDGVLPEFPAGYPTMGGLVERIEAELRTAPAGRHDPRVVVACLSSLTLGYALFGEFVRRGTGLDGRPSEELDAAIQEVLREIAGLAFSGGDVMSDDENPPRRRPVAGWRPWYPALKAGSAPWPSRARTSPATQWPACRGRSAASRTAWRPRCSSA